MKENSRMEDIVSRIICLLFARLIVSNILKWQLFEKLEMRLKPGNRRSFAIEKCLEELGIQSIAGLLNYGFLCRIGVYACGEKRETDTFTFSKIYHKL